MTEKHDSQAVPQTRRFEAALLLRVWFEDDDPQRMRVRGVPLTPDSGSAAAWTTVEDATDAITLWLTGLISREESRSENSSTDHRA